MTGLSPASSIETRHGQEALPLASAVWRCYSAVFGDVHDEATWRADIFERHAARDGFRLVTASDAGEVIGFAWGYIGERGQYWADLIAAALPAGIADDWIGRHFEVVELAVLPGARRHGLGRALHDALLDGIRRRCLLSTTTDDQDAAVRLYGASGWSRLGTLSPAMQVMGLDLSAQPIP